VELSLGSNLVKLAPKDFTQCKDYHSFSFFFKFYLFIYLFVFFKFLLIPGGYLMPAGYHGQVRRSLCFQMH